MRSVLIYLFSISTYVYVLNSILNIQPIAEMVLLSTVFDFVEVFGLVLVLSGSLLFYNRKLLYSYL